MLNDTVVSNLAGKYCDRWNDKRAIRTKSWFEGFCDRLSWRSKKNNTFFRVRVLYFLAKPLPCACLDTEHDSILFRYRILQFSKKQNKNRAALCAILSDRGRRCRLAWMTHSSFTFTSPFAIYRAPFVLSGVSFDVLPLNIHPSPIGLTIMISWSAVYVPHPSHRSLSPVRPARGSFHVELEMLLEKFKAYESSFWA